MGLSIFSLCAVPWRKRIRLRTVFGVINSATGPASASLIIHPLLLFSCSVIPTFCNLMDCSIPGFTVLHHLSEFARAYIDWVSDTIQQSCPLSSPSPTAIYFPASRSFPMSQLITSGGQRIGFSASVSVLPVNIQGWFPLGLSGLISLQSYSLQGLSRSPTPQFKSINFSVLSLLYDLTLTSLHDYWKNHSFDYTDLCRLEQGN